MLVLDLDGTGLIVPRNQVVFTDWDPTAQNDMAALRNVFDTNQNGLLDAGDARWSSFKLLVTNADGTVTLLTLAEAGVRAAVAAREHARSTMRYDGCGAARSRKYSVTAIGAYRGVP